ncbi:MAG: 3-methylitaconate isomerase [Gracilibacteraceae bacterium]|jgi:2-methylaconitate cis-trans-isomerase PrpF|nr:3-methylitaconate isomerase [Gracilibacteraceae bacterium]
MHPQMIPYQAAIARGGTSKGIFIRTNELPSEPKQRDAVIRAIFGSPDARQIDGLGGADMLTSKLGIIGPPTRPDADIDYTFAQVDIFREFVDYIGNCGNISAMVGPLAVDWGFVPLEYPVTTVRIHQTNTQKIIKASVPVTGGKAAVTGDFRIDGVPGTGARIDLDFSDLAGAITGKLLPTGQAADIIHMPGRDFQVSVVDAGTLDFFIRAEDLGLRGNESPTEIESNTHIMALLEQIRCEVAYRSGLVKKPVDATEQNPLTPQVVIIAKSSGYVGLNNVRVEADDIDVAARLLFMQRVHKTYAGTGTVCTGVAARISGTILYDLLSPEARLKPLLRIGHPGGVISVKSAVDDINGQLVIRQAEIARTARLLMEGTAYIKKDVLNVS